MSLVVKCWPRAWGRGRNCLQGQDKRNLILIANGRTLRGFDGIEKAAFLLSSLLRLSTGICKQNRSCPQQGPYLAAAFQTGAETSFVSLFKYLQLHANAAKSRAWSSGAISSLKTSAASSKLMEAPEICNACSNPEF